MRCCFTLSESLYLHPFRNVWYLDKCCGGGAHNSSSYRDDEIMFAGALKLVKNFIMIVKIIILLHKKVINFFCIANFNNNFLLNSWRISVPSSSCPGTSFLVVARH